MEKRISNFSLNGSPLVTHAIKWQHTTFNQSPIFKLKLHLLKKKRKKKKKKQKIYNKPEKVRENIKLIN